MNHWQRRGLLILLIIGLYSGPAYIVRAASLVTAQGTFTYFNRSNSLVAARYVDAYLYDDDLGNSDDLLASTATNSQGFFQFPAQTNDDADDSLDPDRHLDLYVIWETDYIDNGSTNHRVVNFAGNTYKWQSYTYNNAPDGITSFTSNIPNGATSPAMWIFQDLRNSWEYIFNQSSPHFDPGSVTAKWETDANCFPFEPFLCSSFFYGGVGGPFVFISHQSRNSADTIVHETSHHYMYNATGWWMWGDIGCYEHQIFSQEFVDCAWSEGWADFIPLMINGDTCFDFGTGPCGAGGDPFENLETRSRNDNPPQFPWGDGVEGRVAGALYDLFDSTNEGFDSATFGFDPIADIVFQGVVEYTFTGFWESWKSSGQNQHHALRGLYQNTIDYDTDPRFSPLLPDRTVLQSIPWTHAIDLWQYSVDDESTDVELTFQVHAVSDGRCGITLDNHWINISPQAGWLGGCDATIRVSDSIKAAYDTFRVNIIYVSERVYLPITLK